MKILLAISSFVLFAACASVPQSSFYLSPDPNAPKLQMPPQAQQLQEAPIDLDGLQREVGIEYTADQLGFQEKSFNTCTVSSRMPASDNCHQQYFVAVNFQLLCRNSEGTISRALTRDEMFPLSGRTVTWSLPHERGSVQLDSQGKGQVRTVASTSMKSQRLRLTVDNDFLVQRAGEMTRIITPQNWCN